MLLATIFLLVAPLAWAFADPDVDSGQSGADYVKEVQFLFSFAKFVQWPSRKFTQPDSPLVIGIVGTDPSFGDLLSEATADKRIFDHTVIVRRVEDVGEWRKCHILFVSRSAAGRLASILSAVHNDNVLTVGESDKFISKGGIINFVMVGDQLKFQISDSAARHANLKIDSRLLALRVLSGQSP
jgi:hypothetical protein